MPAVFLPIPVPHVAPTAGQLEETPLFTIEAAKSRKIPIVTTFGGGYASDPKDTIFMQAT